jgi:hypothetical protein
MGEAENPFRLDNTSILYIYKLFKHLPMQWMAIWVHPYFIKPMEVCQAGWTRVTTVYKPYQYDIVNSRKHFRLKYTSISPSDAVDGHMDASLVHQIHGGGLSWLNQGNNWVQTLPLCQGRGQEPLQTGCNFYLKYV